MALVHKLHFFLSVDINVAQPLDVRCVHFIIFTYGDSHCLPCLCAV